MHGVGVRLGAALLSLALLGAPAPRSAVAQQGPGPSPGADGWDRPLSSFSVDLWTEDDGLPQNMATAIAQTPDGYLWVGMERGLARFDGVRFELFDATNTPVLAGAWVTALWADPDGTLWIGTNGGGVTRLRDGRFTRTAADSLLADAHINALFRDRDGALWIGTNGRGLFRLSDGRAVLAEFSDALPSQFVIDVVQDEHGVLWVGTIEGVSSVAPGGTVRAFTEEEGLPGVRVRDMAAGADGSVWVGTTDGGVTRFRDGRILTNLSQADGLTSDYVMALHVDPDGTVWVGTNGNGLNRVRDGEVSTLTSGANQLPGDLVYALARDRHGSLWIGLTGVGLARIRPGTFSTLGEPAGLSADITLALLEDRSGDLWIGTAGGGLNRIRDGQVTTIGSADGLAHDVVLALEEAPDGDIWVGMAANGISRIRDGDIETFDRGDGLASTQVADIAVDSAGAIWLATLGSGLQRWRPDPPTTLTTEDGLPGDWITSLLVSADGTLWVGTRRGLARVEAGRVVPVEVPESSSTSDGASVTALYQDDRGTIWVGTHRGILRIRDGRIDRFDGAVDPDLAREFHTVVTDTLGNVWLPSNDGIYRVREADLLAFRDGDIGRVPVNRYGRHDGLRSAEANGGVNPAGLRRRDGTIWFPTMRGAAFVDPARLEEPGPVSSPIIERLAAGDTALIRPSSASLSPEHRTFEIHFTAPTFVYPGELEFRYRLAGFDDDWVYAGDRRAAYYTDLGPGQYRFMVAVRRENGPWIEGESIPVQLEARLHETGAFLALVMLGLLGVGAGAYHLRIQHFERREDELLALMAERERAEQALRLNEEHLRLALEAGRMGTWEWAPDGDRVSASGSTARILGFQPGQTRRTYARLRSRTSREDAHRLRDELARVAANGGELDLHFPLSLPDGTRRYVEVRGRAVAQGSDGRYRIAGAVSDLTEIMEAQAELRQREEELRQAQKLEAIGRLAGGIAHDFNNLLTAIGGRTRLLMESLGSDDPNREDVDEIQQAAERAAGLTSQLLTFSRKEVPQPQVLDLNRVIEGMQRMLRGLLRDDVVMELRLAEAIDAVRADPRGIEQILLNLVVNAQDAMPDGGRIVMETRGAAGESATGRVVILSVSDTGHGMSVETRQHAFDPFFTTKPVGKGTGLGLSTVYGIVQQSGGRIQLESSPGQGTRFDVILPAVDDRPALATAAERGSEAPTGSETVLLVEDEPAVRSLTRKLLERRGYTVLEAASGPEALELCERQDRPIDLLISDVVMPELGGRELAAQVRLMHGDVAVLLMSGYTEDEVLRRGVPEGGLEFLQKPFQASELLNRVRNILDRREQEERP